MACCIFYFVALEDSSQNEKRQLGSILVLLQMKSPALNTQVVFWWFCVAGGRGKLNCSAWINKSKRWWCLFSLCQA